ncbi:MAG: cytochrome C oxidase subunit IV family protein [Ignavibacteriaceae bacterium]|nr:cytochrome C oxidase subunit IV family protein [Ignavibacteriaceae bacterium]
MIENQNTHEAHAHSYGIYILVWLGLLALTVVTVTVAGLNFGALTVGTALLIASVKSFLVLKIFMHLNVEQKVFKVFVGVALLFIVISFALLFADYSFLRV